MCVLGGGPAVPYITPPSCYGGVSGEPVHSIRQAASALGPALCRCGGIAAYVLAIQAPRVVVVCSPELMGVEFNVGCTHTPATQHCGPAVSHNRGEVLFVIENRGGSLLS